MGLKFGIHVMRGIPRQSVKANTPIEGSDFKAADAANTGNICPWCPDMFGVDADKPAGQAWYDSILRQYAAWGVDFVKVDDLSSPYSKRRNRGDPPGDRPLRPRHRLQHLARRDPGERSGARRDACEHVADFRRLLGQLGFAQPQLRPARRMAGTRRTRSLAGRRHDSAGPRRQAQCRRRPHDAISPRTSRSR